MMEKSLLDTSDDGEVFHASVIWCLWMEGCCVMDTLLVFRFSTSWESINFLCLFYYFVVSYFNKMHRWGERGNSNSVVLVKTWHSELKLQIVFPFPSFIAVITHLNYRWILSFNYFKCWLLLSEDSLLTACYLVSFAAFLLYIIVPGSVGQIVYCYRFIELLNTGW